MAYYDEQTAKINQMYDAMKKQRTDQAAAQNNQAITELRRQLSEQLPQYQTARAQADVGEVQNMNKLKEYIASKGAFNSGDNFSRAAQLMALRNNSVNQINGNENQFTTGINNKIADSNNNYNTTLNSINSDVDAQRAQALMNLQQQIRQEQLQQAAQRAAAAKSSSSATAKASKTNDTNQVWSVLESKIGDGTADEFLKDNAQGIIQNLGYDVYDKMRKRLTEAKTTNRDYLDARVQNAKNQKLYDAFYGL